MAGLPDLTDAPPVASLLDVDFYKFTMGQYVFRRHARVPVRYRLVCRTPGARLARRIPVEAFQEGLDAVRSFSFGPAEIDWLRNLAESPFGEDYLGFLGGLRLPAIEVGRRGDDFELEYEGPWAEVIHWETLVLSVLSELLSRSGAEAIGRERLEAKIAALRRRPGIRFASFGTRRRRSGGWQREVEARLRDALPDQFLGTSSAESARQNGLQPVGTVAHEVFMVGAGLAGDADAAIRESPVRVLEAWWETYGTAAALVPTDTWSSEAFFRDVPPAWAERLAGVRQDSGDPVRFGEGLLRWYAETGVDPAGKRLVFSDGLELPDVLALHDRFGHRMRVSFGWGTNLTNDCGQPTYSLVVKPVRAAGRPLVKLSDDPGKSTGDPQTIARYRRIFDAPATWASVPKY